MPLLKRKKKIIRDVNFDSLVIRSQYFNKKDLVLSQTIPITLESEENSTVNYSTSFIQHSSTEKEYFNIDFKFRKDFI